jgi:type IV pilus assembly protein PilV
MTCHMNITPDNRGHVHGFTLIEVLVSLIVISVGLLGIVGMEGLALSSSSSARMRSLASIEAASMAAAMHANRAFWSANVLTVTLSGQPATVMADTTGTLGGGGDCTAATGAPPCSPVTLAAADLQSWGKALSQVLPNPQATINCPNGPPPLSCTITLQWTENVVNLSAAQRAGAAGATFQNNQYVLYVQP